MFKKLELTLANECDFILTARYDMLDRKCNSNLSKGRRSSSFIKSYTRFKDLILDLQPNNKQFTYIID